MPPSGVPPSEMQPDKMTPLQTLHGNILTPNGWVKGQVQFDQRIRAILADPVAPKHAPNHPPHPGQNSEHYILPGFIDLHVHGGGGRDSMQGGDAMSVIAQTHARHGTTSLLATTMTAPTDEIDTALTAIGLACATRAPNAARVLGVHLEGPFINPAKLGAQPAHAVPATLAQVEQWATLAPLRVMTLAPELAGHLELIRTLSRRGIRMQIGHSNGSYEEGMAALRHGAAGFTHLYNAMSPLQQRAPGMVGAALALADYAELIPDLLHVHPGAIKAALRAIPHLYCVTDATAATDMPDGAYMLGRMQVHKCQNGVRLADGTLAGSTLTMDAALRNLVTLGLDLADAALRVSTYPANYLGLNNVGRIGIDCLADLVLLDRALNLVAVYIDGTVVDCARPT
jgi:N-acetylglucosamine-6-phosphate deacetylase